MTRFSSIYCVVCGGCLLNKLHNYQFENRILSILTMPVFSLWCCTEIARVALGYAGNLAERVPMISAFLLLTIFPQLVAVVFLTFIQDPVGNRAATALIYESRCCLLKQLPA
mmetsp:Transcript_30806/g.95311  ORF Transcript_30806/g.95311 Transcript_30806/m.95311 type:complete len:112 (+) Transcript_30806:104-439(+)